MRINLEESTILSRSYDNAKVVRRFVPSSVSVSEFREFVASASDESLAKLLRAIDQMVQDAKYLDSLVTVVEISLNSMGE